eukprot:1806657-Pyramimonas_sp.AAC.1
MDVGAVDAKPRCDICGKTGHLRRECWHQGRPGGKGQGKGEGGSKGKGKGRDGKGKDSSKGGKTGGGRGYGRGNGGGVGAGTGDGSYFNGESGHWHLGPRESAVPGAASGSAPGEQPSPGQPGWRYIGECIAAVSATTPVRAVSRR